MEIEEFALGDSSIHKMDPRAKIIAALVFSLVVALSHSLHGVAAATIFPVALIVFAGMSLRKVALRLLVVNAFIVFLWFFLPFTVPGEVIFSWGPLQVHREGVFQALLITLKSNAIVLTVMVLLGTSPIFSLVHAMSHMGLPDKLVHLFFFCFRYIHVIHEEYHRLSHAMKIRGFKPRTDMHTYRTYAYLVGMLLVRSFDRSSRILAAMKCRGFRNKFYILHHYEMKNYDYVLTASSALVAGLLLVAK